jgi:tripartite-type tricarboxylate transporter receptor subunit TctC
MLVCGLASTRIEDVMGLFLNALKPARAAAATTVLLTIAAASPVYAQSYPDKPIRLVVPSPPGGGTDTLSRLVAAKLGETLKWTIVADNKPGAGGNIGMDAAAKSAADGYTIVMGESSNLTINPYLYTTMPYDAAKDLAPIVLVGTVPLVLVTSPARPYDSVASVVAAAKEKPLFFASSGNGTVGHLTGEMWLRLAAVKLEHVPYRGGAQAVADVMGGQVDLNFASIPSAASLIEAGKLRPIAVTALRRSEQLPNVPTFEEAGFKGFTAQVLYGLLAPAGTPPPIIEKLNVEVNRVLQSPEFKESVAKVGVEVRGGTPAEFAAFLAAEREKWSRAVAASGARVD